MPSSWEDGLVATPAEGQNNRPTPTLATATAARLGDQEFTLITRSNRGRSKRRPGKPAANEAATAQSRQINITPASYASMAAAAVGKPQDAPSNQPRAALPTITEVTVLRTGGHSDSQVERCIRARAADAIAREVRLNMAKAVARPIPLRAGRWSVHPRSKGNFVYSFDGNIPFDHVLSYEHILLAPFQGSGQLCPSLGWTRLLVHGVPVTDNDDMVFGPDALLKEVRTLPGLKRAFFSMPLRWLKPIERISSSYSSITFALSDPDGTATNLLLNGRAALFGKEVSVQKWINKLALVQCLCCHALGHIKMSKVCPLGKNSVWCYICGGSHKSEEHDQKCPKKH